MPTAQTRSAETMITREFSDFRAAVSSSFVPLRVTSDRIGSFTGQIRAINLDEIHVSEVTARQHMVTRTPELIAQGDTKYFKLSLQLSGSGLLVQDNREALLLPGDIAVYDTERPYSMVFDDDFSMMVVMFPQTLIDLPAESIRQLTAVRFEDGRGIAGMVGPFLRRMAENLDALSSSTGARLGHNAVDLIGTMFASELGAVTGHDGLASRLRGYIEEHLGDPELGPASIAAAHFISTRHLHGVFREKGTSVSTWIRTRRLEHCRRDLLDPLLLDRPIGTIAARWGFIDAAHFSRLFKATFDESPSETRSRIG